MRSISLSMYDPAVQVGSQPHTRKTKLPIMSAPRTVCATSRWNCTPYTGRSSATKAAHGSPSVVARRRKPGGGSTTWSPWLIHTCVRSPAAKPAKIPSGSSTVTCARPYSRRPRSTTPPSRWVMSCIP